jgi:hypothetical protein
MKIKKQYKQNNNKRGLIVLIALVTNGTRGQKTNGTRTDWNKQKQNTQHNPKIQTEQEQNKHSFNQQSITYS